MEDQIFMRRVLISVFFVLFISDICFSQVDEIWLDKGIESNDTYSFYSEPPEEIILNYVNDIRSTDEDCILGGYINSIFHELIDSIEIIISHNNVIIDKMLVLDGFYRLKIPAEYIGNNIDITTEQSDYHALDTSLIVEPSKTNILNLKISPKYKILLKGRVYSGNMPLEGVDVEIDHGDDVFQMTTRGCFYDKEDYWNCLFNGMFIQALTTEDPTDSVMLHFNKSGMKPLNLAMTFSEYDGNVLELKMKYTSRLPEIPNNYFSLKLAFPFATFDNDWFVGISYSRLLNISGFHRISVGLDANMIISTVTVEYPTFTGLENSRTDSTYISGFVGPSVAIWLLNPDLRHFATYTGCTFSVLLNSADFILQPFLGTRFMLDFNKALNLEIRYASYERDIVHYTFNPYGNAERYAITNKFDKFLISLGVQVVF